MPSKDQADPIAPVLMSPAEAILCRVGEEFDGDGTGVMRLRVRGVVEESPLRAALYRLQMRHPKLRARVASRGGRYYFEFPVHPDPIPQEFVDTVENPLPWQKVMTGALRAPFDIARGPLARLVVLRNRQIGVCDIFFVIHHAIADAPALFTACGECLSYYEAAEGGIDLPPAEPLSLVTIPRIEQTASLRHRASLFFGILKGMRSKQRGDWTTLPFQAGVPPESTLVSTVLSPKETAALDARCRRERASVMGAHFAAAMCTLGEMMTDGGVRVRCRVPINIRPLLAAGPHPLRHDDMGCFLSAFEGSYSADAQTAFWDMARQMRGDIMTFLRCGGPQVYYNVLRFARTRALMKARKRVTLAVNCPGVARLRERYGSLVTEECSTMAKNIRLGPSLGVGGITLGGRLCVGVCGADLPPDFFRLFSEGFIARLRAAAQPGDDGKNGPSSS